MGIRPNELRLTIANAAGGDSFPDRTWLAADVLMPVARAIVVKVSLATVNCVRYDKNDLE